METANLVTYSDLWQVRGILAGVWFAYLFAGHLSAPSAGTSATPTAGTRKSTAGSRNWKRKSTAGSRRWKRPTSAGIRSCLRAIGALYRHVHADGRPRHRPRCPTLTRPSRPRPADN